jgi:Uma2 family endonuclease
MHSPVDADHQRLVRFLSWLLQAWCGSRKFGEVLNGPTAVKVAPRIGREPDIFVIHRRNVTAARGKVLKVVPRLAVEVVSPGTMRLDYDVKAREYAAYGIPEYWTVDRERRVLRRHFLSRGAARGRRRYEATEHVAGVLSSRALPGCRIRVDWLWAEPLPPEMRCWRFVRGASHSPRKRNE